MIGIIDYGLGNLASVLGAVEKLGHQGVISSNPEELAQTDKLILPGVGAFGDGMSNLRSRDLIGPLNRLVIDDRMPVLGICLGSQLIARDSEEFGQHEGLGWIAASVRKIAPDNPALRVPHVGWNELSQTRESVLFDSVPDNALFYYVHSYRLIADEADVVIGECDYGGRFPAAVQSRNIYATQFHPEKSQQHGLMLLNNFLEKA